MPTYAQLIELGGSPNVVGSGARAMGMGGAFIAVADDATAASWNPSGLVQLERPEISAVYEYNYREENYTGTRQPGISGGNSTDFDDLNYLSVVYPIPKPILGRNVVLSLNYQRRYDFERRLDYRRGEFNFGSLDLPLRSERVEYRQRGSLNALSPALAFEVTKRLSFGVAMNIYDQNIGNNEWEETFLDRGMGTTGGNLLNVTYSEFKRKFREFEGENYTIGVLWNATDRLSFGAVYHTRFTADVTRKRSDTTYSIPLTGLGRTTSDRDEQDWRLQFPSAIGVGVAYRFPDDKLTVSADITRREWDEFVATNPVGRQFSPITGRLKDLSSIDPVYTLRLGAEYVFLDESRFVQNYLPSIRAGLLFDPEPASRNPANFFGGTLGVGVLIRDRVNIDFAYEGRYGHNVRQDAFTDTLGRSEAEADVWHHRFLFSTVIYF